MGRHAKNDARDDGRTPRIPLFGRKAMIRELLADNARLKGVIDDIGAMDIVQRRAYLDDLNQRREHEAKVGELDDEIARERDEAASLERSLAGLRDRAELREYGFYDYANPAEDSVALKSRITQNRLLQKGVIRGGMAVLATARFTFNDSAQKGRTFIDDI